MEMDKVCGKKRDDVPALLIYQPQRAACQKGSIAKIAKCSHRVLRPGAVDVRVQRKSRIVNHSLQLQNAERILA
jgi:hypothetical protein